MKHIKKLISIILLACSISVPSHAWAAPAHLPVEEGLELDWEFTETPPKRPQPKLLNAEEYEAKWRIDLPLTFSLIQDKNGILYFSDSQDRVHATYPDGKEKWTVQLDKLMVIDLNLGQDGMIYAHGADPSSQFQITTVYAISPLGEIKWKLTSEHIYSYFATQFAGDVQGNFHYFTDEGLVSRNVKGELNWINSSIRTSKPGDYASDAHSVWMFADPQGNLYLNTAEGEIISLAPLGAERWRTEPLPYLTKYTGFSPHFSEKEYLYLLNEYGLHAVHSSNGKEVDESQPLDAADIQSAGIPTDGNGGFYINDRGTIAKIDRSGEKIWTYMQGEADKGLNLFDPLSDSEGNVYFSTSKGNIVSLNSEGEERFVFLRDAFWTKLVDIVISKNGNVISSNQDIGIAAFGKKEIQVFIDHLAVPLPAAPVNREGTVFVPFRALFERLGLQVAWDARTRTVTGTKQGMTLVLTMGEKTAYLNGLPQQLSHAPMIEHQTAFVPLRWVGETLGADVSWEADSSSVSILTR